MGKSKSASDHSSSPLALRDPNIVLAEKLAPFAFKTTGSLDDKRTLVTVDVLGLASALTCSSEEQRFEWARCLMLKAQQKPSEAPIHHLYSSIERDSFETFHERTVAAEAATNAERAVDVLTQSRSRLMLHRDDGFEKHWRWFSLSSCGDGGRRAAAR